MLKHLLAELFAAERAGFRRSLAWLVLGLSCWLLTLGAALAGLGFVLFAWYRALAETLAPWHAGLIVGCGVLLVTIIVLLCIALAIGQGGERVPPGNRGSGSQREASASADAAGKLGSAVGDMIAKSPIKTSDIVLTALIAGMVLGASPGLREWIVGRGKKKGETGPSD